MILRLVPSQAAVEDEPHPFEGRWRTEIVLRPVPFAALPGVEGIPHLPVHAGTQFLRIPAGGGKSRFPAEFRNAADFSRQEAVVVHKGVLDLSDELSARFPGRQRVPDGENGGGAHGLPQAGAGGHDPCGTDPHMGAGNIPSREEKVFDVPGVKTAQRDPVGLFGLDVDVGFAPPVFESVGMMIVHGPAAVGHDVVERGVIEHVVLGEDAVAHEAAALPFSRKKTDPVQNEVFRAVVAVVLDMVPHPHGGFQKLVLHLFRVSDGIPVAAQFQIPEVLQTAEIVAPAGGKRLFRGIGIGPLWRRKFLGAVGFPHLNETAHAHGLSVGLILGKGFAELGLGLPSHAEIRAGKGG